MIPIYQPYLAKYKTSALEAINSEWISNHGIYIELATNKIKEILNMPYCILMNNGTSATHAMFRALKYKYPAITKVYVPNNVFVAPWNCALLEYDISQLEVMRIDSTTLNIDVSDDYINSLDKDSAVVIVHNLGNIVNVPRLKRLRPDLIFIEDNCEGLFGKCEGIYSGTSPASLCSSVSFYGNKSITTGEGGAFFTHDMELYKYLKTYYSHGMSSVRYIHNVHGTNYRMTNVQAGFLYDQLNDINHILSLKRQVFDRYDVLFDKYFNPSNLHHNFNNNKSLSQQGQIIRLRAEPDTIKATWMYVILIQHIDFEHLEHYMLEKQVQIRPFFYDIHCHEHLKTVSNPHGKLDTKDYVGVMLPSYPELTADQQTYIVNLLLEYIKLGL